MTNAQPPTPTPANKAVPKAKATKDRPKRNRGKGAVAPATPNASEPPTPTTPITPHAPLPFSQHPQQQSQAGQPQPQSQQISQLEQQPQQDVAPPSSFATIEHATEATDWTGVDDKWVNQMPMEFPGNFGQSLNDFGNTNFSLGDDDIINYGEFLNDTDGITMDLGIWEDLAGTEA
jgi:hypothetical protein